MSRVTLRQPRVPAAVVLGLAVLFVGCQKKPPPPPPAQEAPPAPPSAPTITELAPLVDEAGVEDAAPEAAPPKKYTQSPGSANQMRISACCNAMRTQARQLGQSPEAFQMNALAAQCDIFAKQVGPGGLAPEFEQLRQILKSVKLPAACNF